MAAGVKGSVGKVEDLAVEDVQQALPVWEVGFGHWLSALSLLDPELRKARQRYSVVIDREAYETATPTVNLYVYGSGFAQEMRFRNDTSAWSIWEPYNQDKVWSLSSGAGLKEVSPRSEMVWARF